MKRYLFLSIILVLLILSGCSDKKTSLTLYKDPPLLIDSLSILFQSDSLRPVRVQYLNDTLFVSYNRAARIDLYTPLGEFLKTIELASPEPVYPTSFDISDSVIFLSDHTRGMVARFDRDGNYINSFQFLPDRETRLMPFAVKYYGGVLYVSDIGLKKILAISMVDAKGITGMGELILRIPQDSLQFIDFPTAVYVTFEGRLITSNALDGKIEVYTCDGQHIYDFDSIETEKTVTVQAIGLDLINDPELIAKDSNSFDPSGIRNMGRFHLVDANNAQVHMFNPLGEYLNSYNGGNSFKKPSGLTVNYKDSLIYIADPLADKIFIFKY